MNKSTKIGITALMTIILSTSVAGASNGPNSEELSTSKQTITEVTDESAQQVAQKASEEPVFKEVPDFKPTPEEKAKDEPVKAEPEPEPKVEQNQSQNQRLNKRPNQRQNPSHHLL